ncbi:hypothetical protein [Pseudoroseicyclus sp. CXY001]|uniref:hypothetical protein n=1 Tax=Pseudoroseicyclus sp. CXY001 TaxID=3242492 RepID=UPI003570E465
MTIWTWLRRSPAAALVNLCLLAAGGLAVPTTGLAQVSYPPLVIGDDRGGVVSTRVQLLDRLRASGQRVEIRGNICYSACTLYLGAGDVCVSPTTNFGFHGPSNRGAPLAPQTFERWSNIMASYYREPLRSWFMRDARYLRVNMRHMTGRELIRMGYRSC